MILDRLPAAARLSAALVSLVLAAAGSARAEPLPDGQVTTSGSITARLVDPTDRYDHGVLGDAIEAGGMSVKIGGRLHVFRLGADEVFEDLRVRLVDLDGDGKPEALVVKTNLRRGSALAAYRLSDRGIEPLAESEPTGRPHRWLNPVGVAAFDGSGKPLVAAVVTPHVAGSLRFYRLDGRALVEVGRFDGVTDHIAGTRNLDLSCIADVDGDGIADVVVPNRDRDALVVVSFAGMRANERGRVAVQGRVEALACGDRKVEVTFHDGRTVGVDLRAAIGARP